MFTLTRRGARSINVWPGYVDALAALLMVVIFVLLIFTLAQFLLRQLVSDQNLELEILHQHLAALTDELGLARERVTEYEAQIGQLSDAIAVLAGERAALLVARDEDQARLAAGERRIAALTDLVASQAAAVDEERALTAEAQAEVARLDQRLTALQQQLREIAEALAVSEADRVAQAAEIADLGTRLNIELARRVNELEHYRSEFFGRVRQAIGDQPDLRIEGDRFIFQSELLFASGVAELNDAGRAQLARLAETLAGLEDRIPPEIDWILRIDGHTDPVPLTRASPYRSNWELSTARALSVVDFLIAEGLSPRRIAATGFGEHRPLDPGQDPDANRRNRRIEIKLTSP